MGGSLSSPNKIKDVYKKLVFYDDNKLKIDNGTADVTITDADNFGGDTMSELDDTNLTSPANGALLRYDSASGKWIDDNEINGGTFI
jgi:hypothetical protein|tara:strand:+ start:1797 stop:2057 length:261 start_codon:yes stop_codon:yes gene_type:complete